MAQRSFNPDELPGNSLNIGNEPPKVSPIVSGRTKSKGRSMSSEIRNIVNDLFRSVVIPGTRTMLYEFLNGGLQQTILGKNAPNLGRGLPTMNRAYHSIYGATRANIGGRTYLQRATPTLAVAHQDIYFNYEDEARLVLAAMVDRIANFGRVSLMDMRNLCGLETTPTQHRWGWTDLNGSDIVPTSEGWIITLPDMEYI